MIVIHGLVSSRKTDVVQKEDLLGIVLALKRRKIVGQIVPGLPAVAPYDDDFYENYEYDIISPLTRIKILRALKDLSWQSASGCRIVHAEKNFDILIPKPTSTLGCSPIKEVELKALRQSINAYLLTPTQAFIAAIQVLPPDKFNSMTDHYIDFVRQTPVNLDKVNDWSKNHANYATFWDIRPKLYRIQADIFRENVRRHRF